MARTTRHLPLFLLCLLALGLVTLVPAVGDRLPQATADELDGAGKKEGEEPEEDEKGADLGEAVSFMDQVNEAIELGVLWLKQKPALFEIKKGPVAHWGLVKGSRNYGGGDGPQYRHPAGPTALALYTLLKCGVDPKDEVIEKGFTWLKELHVATMKWDGLDGKGGMWRLTDCVSSYELSVMILALTAKYDKYKKSSASKSAQKKGKLKIRNGDDKKWLIELVERLVLARGQPEPTGGDGNRGWRYNLQNIKVGNVQRNVGVPPHSNQDLSSTQLATLALYSATRFGLKIKPEIWLDIITFSLDQQEETGPVVERFVGSSNYAGPKDKARGFAYIKGSPDGSEGIATGAMTGCGVVNLLVAREVLQQSKKGLAALKASGLESKIEKGIWDGLAWLNHNWSDFENKNSKTGYHIYYLYALERAMDIINKRLVGKHLWYEEGAKALLARKQTHMYEVKIKRNTELMRSFFWNTQATHEPQDVLDTCFALLFLKRATRDMIPGGVVTGD
jgi:hypothetical protein